MLNVFRKVFSILTSEVESEIVHTIDASLVENKRYVFLRYEKDNRKQRSRRKKKEITLYVQKTKYS